MAIKLFDIECFPNLFSLAAKDYREKTKELFYISDDHNDLGKIIAFARERNTLVGYNNKEYDNLFLYYLVQNEHRLMSLPPCEITRELKNLSNEIINHRKVESHNYNELRNVKMFRYVDLFAIFNTVERLSLKQVSINLQFWNVQTLPYPHDKVLTPEEIQKVLEYNFNDVEITELLLDKQIDELRLRQDINKKYGVDVLNQNRTGIAKTILNKYYSEATGLKYKDFKDLRSYYREFNLGDVIFGNHEFRTKPFQDLLTYFRNAKVGEVTKNSVKKVVYSEGFPITFALGGLHSVDGPAKYKTDENYIIRDCDVASMYPRIMVNNKIIPRHCSEKLIDILLTLLEDRLAHKKVGNKVEAEALKIVINSIYGLLGSEYYWLKDNMALVTVTVNGQLYLARLIEDLQLAGIEVISANTDGIVCKIPRHKEDIYNKICSDWAEMTRFELEYKDYEHYVRRDVNNYMSVDTKGGIKQKGEFVDEISLTGGYWCPVVAKALNQYFRFGIKPEDFIPQHGNIYDFMSSQKADKHKFRMEYHSLDNSKGYSEIKIDKLQENNRWLVVNYGGKILKKELDEARIARLQEKKAKGKKISQKDLMAKMIHVDKENYVALSNRVEDTNVSNYDLKFDYYVEEAYEIIRQIEPLYTQTSLF